MMNNKVYLFTLILLSQFACSSPYLEISKTKSKFTGEESKKIQIKDGLYEAVDKYVYTSQKKIREMETPSYRYWVFQDGKLAMSSILTNKIKDSKDVLSEFNRDNMTGKYYYSNPESIYGVIYNYFEFQNKNTHLYFNVISNVEIQLLKIESLYEKIDLEKEYYL